MTNYLLTACIYHSVFGLGECICHSTLDFFVSFDSLSFLSELDAPRAPCEPYKQGVVGEKKKKGLGVAIVMKNTM